MKQKYFLIIACLVVMFFIPTQKANATSTYVKVKINNTSSTTGSSFSLPAGTKLSIFSGAVQQGATTTINVETAVGSSIYTASAIELSSGTNYTAKLEVPICSGATDSRNSTYCWYKGNDGENCNTVCARNSTTALSTPYCNEADLSCTIMKLLGISCPTCYTGGYGPYSSYGSCYSGGYTNYPYCDVGYSGLVRICTCKPPLGVFSFPFTL